MLSASLFIVFPLLMAFAAFSDMLTMTIPNRVPVLLCLSFLCVALASGLSAGMIGLHVAVAFVTLGFTFGCFAAGWMGGGDAKLLAATALWFGPTPAMSEYILFASLLGGLLTMAIIIARGRMIPCTGVGFVDHLLQKDTGVPYGMALGAAGLLAFSSSDWVEIALQSAAR